MSGFTDAFGLVVTLDADGVTYTRSDGLVVVAQSQREAANSFGGMAPAGWTPPPGLPLLRNYELVDRFSPAENAAMTVIMRTNNVAWGWFVRFVIMAPDQTVNLGDPIVLTGLNTLASLGVFTAPRLAQILDLSQSSP